MELISLKCPYPNCKNMVLELLEEGEHARFKKIGNKVSGFDDVILVACPSSNHTFHISFGSIHRTSFQP